MSGRLWLRKSGVESRVLFYLPSSPLNSTSSTAQSHAACENTSKYQTHSVCTTDATVYLKIDLLFMCVCVCVCVCVCACVHVCGCTRAVVYVWRSKDNLSQSTPSTMLGLGIELVIRLVKKDLKGLYSLSSTHISHSNVTKRMLPASTGPERVRHPQSHYSK